MATNVRALQYVDTGLANGTTYYYVVSAANILGESGNSPEASATPALPPCDRRSLRSLLLPARSGSTINISVTTRNQGTGVAGPSTTRFYISANILLDSADMRLTEVRRFRLCCWELPRPSHRCRSRFRQLSPPASTYLIAKADTDDVLFESQETNNTSARTLTVGPDLLVSAMTVPAIAAPGSQVNASYTVRNQGAGQAGASTLKFFWSANSALDAADTPLGQTDVPAIAGAGTVSGQATVTIPTAAATGTYYIVADADSSKVVPEASESNNAASRAVRIGGDLVVAAFDAPAVGGVGVPLTINDTTRNTGASPIGASLTHFYLSADAVLTASDTLLGTRSVEALAADQASAGSTTVAIPTGTPAGTMLLVCASGWREPAERDAGGKQRSDSIVQHRDQT